MDMDTQRMSFRDGEYIFMLKLILLIVWHLWQANGPSPPSRQSDGDKRGEERRAAHTAEEKVIPSILPTRLSNQLKA